jgi:hypothetical protein
MLADDATQSADRSNPSLDFYFLLSQFLLCFLAPCFLEFSAKYLCLGAPVVPLFFRFSLSRGPVVHESPMNPQKSSLIKANPAKFKVSACC